MENRKFKKFLATLLAAVLLISAIPMGAFTITASAETTATSGTTGDCTWSLDGTVLTISGNGEMGNYGESNPAPWGTAVTRAVINSSVKSVGAEAFKNCKSLASVTIPATVTAVNDGAFYGCTTLENVTLPSNLKTIGEWAFYGSGITSIIIPNGVTTISYCAFGECGSLNSITIPKSVTKIDWNAFDGLKSTTDVWYQGNYTDKRNIDFPDYHAGVLYVNWHCVTCENDNHVFDSVEDTTCNVCGAICNKAGVNCIWTLDGTTLTISGYGEMRDYYYSSRAPWGTNITSVIIKNGVTSIGRYAFYSSTSLTSVTIGNGVTSIGYDAFNGCTGLTSVTIPDSVISIGDYAFSGCTSLTSITIPDSVTSIGWYAFYDCTGLTSVAIGKGVTSIGDYAFSACTGLTSITIGNGVTSIGDRAFIGCKNLNKVNITDIAAWCNIDFECYNNYDSNPNPLSYAHNLYLNDELVTDLVIPDTVTTIKPCAFYECTRLTSITIPDSVTSIGSFAFYGCDNLKNVNVSENNKNYSSISGVLFNKSQTELIQYPNGKTEKEYVIPNSVTSIGDYAFYNCGNLTGITIPNSVTSIGYYAFGYCDSLNKVNIFDIAAWCNIDFDNLQANPLVLANNLYINEKLVTDLTIPNTVTSIKDYAFRNCECLKSVVLSNKLTSIGEETFSFCENLTSVIIPDTVTIIGDSAFCGCTSLTSITIPDSVKSIGGQAFWGTGYYDKADNWENGVLYIGNHLIEAKSTISGDYTIKDGTKTIGDHAFYGCKITGITIPDSVTSIGRSAFKSCYNLKKVNITDIVAWCNIDFKNPYNTKYDFDSNPLCCAHNLYLNDELITNLVIPNTVCTIKNYAFHGCTGLTSVTIPNSVTSIGDYAFCVCTGLTSITIPNSVTSICDYAFCGCTDLTNITIPDSVTGIGDDAFYNTGYYNGYNTGNWKNNVLYIGNHLIATQSFLGSYTIKDGTKTIAASAFSYCTYLTSITIPDSVTSIGDSAFFSCSNLKNVYYTGSKTDKSNIAIGTNNDELNNATWYYNVCLKHTFGDVVNAKPATCTEDGNVAYKQCTKCKQYFAPNATTDSMTALDKITIEATGHKFGDVVTGKAATCTEDGVAAHKHCSECEKDFAPDAETNSTTPLETTVVEATGHTFGETVTANAPTCTEDGNVAYKQCTKCEQYFAPEAETTEATPLETTVVEATGHKFGEIDKGTDATCTEDGVAAHKHCSGCEKDFAPDANDDSTTPLDTTVIPAHHTPEYVAKVPATTENEGTEAHYKCTECEKLFKDEACTEETTLDELKIDKVPVEAGWVLDGTGWWYRNNSAKGYATGWAIIDGAWYYFNEGGYMVTGWLNLGGTWYYMSGSGAMVTDWQIIGGSWYYFYADGSMAVNAWIGNYYLTASGAMATPSWQLDGNGWWYSYGDGTYATGWAAINGSWYYFNASGYMVTGWLNLGGTWYYMSGSGAMVTDWQIIGGSWYYFYADGSMAANTWIGNYWLSPSGAMA